ncbi:MAG TPA: ferredoxin-type protein NapF [Thiotrichales bacterium]|nr:ferredoxin-type protein NapF [Thiotrichales bacterium]
MTRGISRFQFLRGDFGGRETSPRPPWSISEQAFLESCSRCDACFTACPERILVRGRGGYPEIDFSRGECTFCGRCARACPTAALGVPEGPPWLLKAEIDERCLAAGGVVCRTCGEQCETGAIRFRLAAGGVARPELDLARCTGCGACVAPCPAQAIRVLPPHQRKENVA